jgi:murein tripeptide amidase MpaA
MAFSYPWSLGQNKQWLFKLKSEIDFKFKDVEFNLKSLGSSMGKRPVYYMTIEKNSKQKKKVIFISARVHPGEVVSSHVFRGFLTSLLFLPHHKKLLSHYKFICIPIINVDGVYQGHFRDNILGQNLNRFYSNPSLKAQPELFHLDELIKSVYQSKSSIECYIDLHGHLNAGGIFMYGNHHDQVQVNSNNSK